MADEYATATKGARKVAMILGVIFAGFFIIVFAYGVYEAREFPRLARIFPYWISLGALILAVIQLGFELRKYLLQIEDAQADFVDLAPDRSLPPRLVFKRALGYLLWFVGLYAAIWVFGFVIAMIGFLVAFLRYDAELSWWKTLQLAAGGFVFVVAISWLMSLYWPDGLIAQWVELPWPLS
jgi:putative tricarboxylic transport membrane protein